MSKELPDISELKASQAQGATGKGTSEESYAEVQACFNMGTGVPTPDPSADYSE